MGAGACKLGLPLLIGEADNGIVSRDIEGLADQGHAEWPLDALGEQGLGFRDAITVSIAQQHDFVGAFGRRPGVFHDDAGGETAQTFWLTRLRRRLGHENIAIGQDIEPARVVQALGQAGHNKTFRCLGSLPGRPTDHFGDGHLR